MEGGERSAAPPQRPSGAAGEFFICFSRPSSSLRAWPSPARKDKFRLKNSGSLKGGQSPAIIPAGQRRKSFPVEVAEPSSPKVTCIGQVKVKTARMKKKTKRKKKNKKKTASSSSCSPIHGFCEAVRSVGSEFNCFLPCGGGRKEAAVAAPPPTTTESGLAPADEPKEEIEEKRESFCAVPPKNALILMRCRSDPVKMAALTTRLCGSPTRVGVEDIERENGGDDGEAGELTVAAAEEHGGEEETVRRRSVEVHSGEDREKEVESKQVEREPARRSLERESFRERGGDLSARRSFDIERFRDRGGEETARRSVERKSFREKAGDEPARRSSERGSFKEKASEESAGRSLERESFREREGEESARRSLEGDRFRERGGEESARSSLQRESLREKRGEEPARSSLERENVGEKASEAVSAQSCLERKAGGEKVGEERARRCLEREIGREKVGRRHSFSTEKDARRLSCAGEKEGRRRWSFSLESSRRQPSQRQIDSDFVTKKMKNLKIKKKPKSREDPEVLSLPMAAAPENPTVQQLPDCLLLMMYEPKLSMEVSKETWVCSSDFLSHHRQRNRQKQPKVASEALPLPPAEELAVERKAAAAPFGLTRCKSEPMRPSAKMDPDVCFWKNRHRPIGEAGIGF